MRSSPSYALGVTAGLGSKSGERTWRQRHCRTRTEGRTRKWRHCKLRLGLSSALPTGDRRLQSADWAARWEGVGEGARRPGGPNSTYVPVIFEAPWAPVGKSENPPPHPTWFRSPNPRPAGGETDPSPPSSGLKPAGFGSKPAPLPSLDGRRREGTVRSWIGEQQRAEFYCLN